MDEEQDDRTYKVVVNHEEQYSIWPVERANPLGWRDGGPSGLGKRFKVNGLPKRAFDVIGLANVVHFAPQDVDLVVGPDGYRSLGARWNYATIQVTPEEMAAVISAAAQRGGGPPVIGPPLPATAAWPRGSSRTTAR